MMTAHITGPYCTGAAAWAGARPVVVFPQGQRAADDLVFGDVNFDRRDVEDLPAGAVDLGGAGEVGSAATAAGRFVADHHVRVRYLGEGLSGVAVLPSGFAFRGFAQRPGRGLSGPVSRRWSRGVLRVGPQLRFQIRHPGLQRGVLRLEFRDPGLVHFPHRIHLALQRANHCDQVRYTQLFHSSMIPQQECESSGHAQRPAPFTISNSDIQTGSEG
jgi:hypothetical protein